MCAPHSFNAYQHNGPPADKCSLPFMSGVACCLGFFLLTAFYSEPVLASDILGTLSPEEFSSSWIEKFQSEYSSAANQLSEAVTSIHCSGTYSAPYLLSGNNLPDEIIKLKFDFLEKGSLVRLQQGGQSQYKAKINVRNGTESFEVQETGAIGSKKYYLTELGLGSKVKGDKFVDILVRRFVHSTTWIWNSHDLLDSYQSGHLVLEGAEPHHSNPDWIIFRVKFSHTQSFQDGYPGQKNVGHGTIILDPAQSWAIREWEYNRPYEVPFKLLMQVDVTHDSDLGVVPTKGTFRSMIKRTTDSDWEEIEKYSCDFETFEGSNISSSDFTLHAYGVDRPESNFSFLLKVNTAIFILIFSIVIIRRQYAKR